MHVLGALGLHVLGALRRRVVALGSRVLALHRGLAVLGLRVAAVLGLAHDGLAVGWLGSEAWGLAICLLWRWAAHGTALSLLGRGQVAVLVVGAAWAAGGDRLLHRGLLWLLPSAHSRILLLPWRPKARTTARLTGASLALIRLLRLHNLHTISLFLSAKF